MKTVVIQIGNSDNKLTQADWSSYCFLIRAAILRYAETVHFSGFSLPDAAWQNACYVAEFEESTVVLFKSQVEELRKQFRQESVAWLEGETTFV